MPTSRGAGAAPAAAAGAAAAAAAAAASGAANGAAEAAPAAAAAAAAPSAAEVMARGRQIFEELREGGKGISEMCYTALARMAAIAGDPEGAFQVGGVGGGAGVGGRVGGLGVVGSARVICQVHWQVMKTWEQTVTACRITSPGKERGAFRWALPCPWRVGARGCSGVRSAGQPPSVDPPALGPSN